MNGPVDPQQSVEPRRKLPGWLRWLVVPLVVIPASLLIGFSLTRDPRELPSALLNKPAPTFSVRTLDGGVLASSSLRGRPVVVNFWASWCAECKLEHPILMDGDLRYAPNVAFVGVLYEDRVPDALAYLARYGDAGYPNLLDSDGQLAIDFGVSGVPETFFIDARGIVRFKQWGALTADVLERQIQQLLGQK